jgi:hypothetical protein
MKIRFTEDVELEVVTGMKGDEPITEPVTFLKGEQSEIDICDDLQPPFASEIQFGDGCVAFVIEDFWKCVDIDVSTL